jgi:hypothetical protein
MSDTVTWLAGVRCAVMLTFDFDAESQWKQMRLVRTLVGRQREALFCGKCSNEKPCSAASATTSGVS